MEQEKFNPNEEQLKTEVVKSEKKPKLTFNLSEKTDAKKSVIDFFKDQEAYYEEFENDVDIKLEAQTKFRDYSKQLRELFTFGKAQNEAKDHPEKYAEALGLIAHLMGANNPIIRKEESSWQNMDEVYKKESQTIYENTKKIFMEANQLLFPNVKTPDSKSFGSYLAATNHGLEKANIAVLNEESTDVQKQYQKDPEQFLYQLSNHNYSIGAELRNGGFEKAINEEDVDSKSLKSGLAMLYQRELIKNKVQQEVYGNAKTVDEMHKIDTIRNKTSENILPNQKIVGAKLTKEGKWDLSKSLMLKSSTESNLKEKNIPEGTKPLSKMEKLYQEAEKRGIPREKVNLNMAINNLEVNIGISLYPKEKAFINNLDEKAVVKLSQQLMKLMSMALRDTRIGSERAKYYTDEVKKIFAEYK